MANRDKPVVSFTLTEELIKRIEDFQFKNRINSRSKAVTMLIEMALADLEEIEPRELDPIEEMDKLMGILADMKESMKKRG